LEERRPRSSEDVEPSGRPKITKKDTKGERVEEDIGDNSKKIGGGRIF